MNPRNATAISLLLVCGASAHAAPAIDTVNGGVAQGGTLTLRGSGFGVKSPAAPILWDNFDNGTAGYLIDDPTHGHPDDWDTEIQCAYSHGGKHSMEYTSARSYGQGPLAVLQYLYTNVPWSGDPNQGSLPCVTQTRLGRLGELARMYATYRYYIINQGGTHLKMGRIGCGGDVHCAPNVGMTALSPDYYYWFSTRGAGGEQPPVYTDALHVNALLGQWVRDDYWAVISTPDRSDGTIGFWRNGAQIYLSSAALTRSSTAEVAGYQQFFLPYYAQAADDTVYVDDVYIDNTRARVELCASATALSGASEAHCEIQIPSAWADGEIRVTVNQGAFAARDTAYLYVLDSNGTPSNGFRVAIGGGDTTPPAAPRNLRVLP